MPLQLAPARNSEAPTIARMSRDLIERGLIWSWRPRRIATLIGNPDVVVLTARRPLPADARGLANPLLGFAAMSYGEATAHLMLMAVEPAVRRDGIGLAMLEWLEASAQHAGIRRFSLEVRKHNHGAQRFYAALGYGVTGEVRGYYQGVETALRMHKELPSPTQVAAPDGGLDFPIRLRDDS